MRVAVLGAGGLLGRALGDFAPSSCEVTAWTRADLDVRDASEVQRRLRDTAPQWVMNASAYTDVDGAERERHAAFAVNAAAVGDLARVCRELRVGLVHFSTDYVFAGDRAACYREDDPVAPVNTYGASKEAGERLVRESGVRHLIVRTQWIFGAGGRSFLSTVLDRARRRQALRVVDDEFGCCTYVRDLADRAWALAGRAEGTYHVANRGRTSRYEVARHIYETEGAGDCIEAARAADVPVTARRPTSSMLCVDKVEGALGRPMPHWTDAVARYLASQR